MNYVSTSHVANVKHKNYVIPLKGKSGAGTTQGEHVINRASRIISPLWLINVCASIVWKFAFKKRNGGLKLTYVRSSIRASDLRRNGRDIDWSPRRRWLLVSATTLISSPTSISNQGEVCKTCPDRVCAARRSKRRSHSWNEAKNEDDNVAIHVPQLRQNSRLSK